MKYAHIIWYVCRQKSFAVRCLYNDMLLWCFLIQVLFDYVSYRLVLFYSSPNFKFQKPIRAHELFIIRTDLFHILVHN